MTPRRVTTRPAGRALMTEERRRQIMALLEAEGRVTVDELAARFATSAVTIRHDLAKLDAAGLLERTHGGALRRLEDDDYPLKVKSTRHHAQKVRIAAVAASLIMDGETVILDSGTTTAEIARQIRRFENRSINVITNALNVAMLLTDVPFVRLIIPGGIMRPQSHSLSGHMAESALAGLQADRLFLGADGIDPDLGVMTPHLPEAQLNARMMTISREIIVVADSSKLLRRNISRIATVDQLDLLITDSAAPDGIVQKLRDRGLAVRLA